MIFLAPFLTHRYAPSERTGNAFEVQAQHLALKKARHSHVPGGRTPHMKGVGMLVVSLRGTNFGFWSHLGCSGQNAIIFSHEGLVQGCTRKNIKHKCCLCFNMVSFRGQKSLGPAQIGLRQGFNSKFGATSENEFT